MSQLKPKPGMYYQIKRKNEHLPVIKICKLLRKENLRHIGIFIWWNVIELIAINSAKTEYTHTTGKVLNNYVSTGCRIARINSIFRFKIEVEYANSKSN